MGFRFFRRVKILPGVTLNFSKSGISTSVGVRGARLTFGGRGGTRTTIGIPGTGLSYTAVEGSGKRPPKGYVAGRIVVCPRCKNVSPYTDEMVEEQLKCPKCEHLFYLGRNVKRAWLPPVAKCKKCGILIEKRAKHCPGCGAAQHRFSACGCLLIAVGAFLLCSMICGIVAELTGR